jgi:hypothetical protein
MATLEQLIPDAEVLLAFAPEELAQLVLEAAKRQLQNGMVQQSSLALITAGRGMAAYQTSPYTGREKEVELAVAEAWNWLRVLGLLVPASGMNGNHGFCVISRRGQSISTNESVKRFQEAAAFPKSILHPSIADKVWLDIVRGDLADAVFAAFRAVEEAVRHAGNFSAADYGIELIRKAFHPDSGPLTDTSQEKGEREALSHLFECTGETMSMEARPRMASLGSGL